MILILFLCFTLIPALEIYLLIKVGGQIGALNTFGLLILVGIVGATIAKSQGRALLIQTQAALSRGEIPAASLLHGLMVVIGGVLMVTPGFFTDVIGLLFVLPGTRHMIVVLIRKYLARQLELGRIHVFGSASAGGFGGFRTGGPHGPQGPFGRSVPHDDEMREVSPRVIDVNSIRIDPENPRKTSTDDE